MGLPKVLLRQTGDAGFSDISVMLYLPTPTTLTLYQSHQEERLTSRAQAETGLQRVPSSTEGTLRSVHNYLQVTASQRPPTPTPHLQRAMRASIGKAAQARGVIHSSLEPFFLLYPCLQISPRCHASFGHCCLGSPADSLADSTQQSHSLAFHPLPAFGSLPGGALSPNALESAWGAQSPVT